MANQRAQTWVEELADLWNLADGWNGEDSLAPLSETFSNLQDLLLAINVGDPSLTPNMNGTLSAEWIVDVDHYAYLEVGYVGASAMVKRAPLESVFINSTVKEFPTEQFAELVTAITI